VRDDAVDFCEIVCRKHNLRGGFEGLQFLRGSPTTTTKAKAKLSGKPGSALRGNGLGRTREGQGPLTGAASAAWKSQISSVMKIAVGVTVCYKACYRASP
jgi:hypothetical protein